MVIAAGSLFKYKETLTHSIYRFVCDAVLLTLHLLLIINIYRFIPLVVPRTSQLKRIIHPSLSPSLDIHTYIHTYIYVCMYVCVYRPCVIEQVCGKLYSMVDFNYWAFLSSKNNNIKHGVQRHHRHTSFVSLSLSLCGRVKRRVTGDDDGIKNSL